MPQVVNVLVHGVGNVGRTLLELFVHQRRLLAERHDLTIRVVGAVDSQGGVFSPQGLDPATLIVVKQEQGTVAALPEGKEGLSALDCLEASHSPPLLLESTLVDLDDGGPGLAAVRENLARGGSVVSANKGPLVLAFAELESLAREQGGVLAYSATVCGGLPVINLGRYDLAHTRINRLEGIVNSTTNHILTEMANGHGFEEALQAAQRAGIAEADPTLDVSGWDAANKLIILANSILRYPTTRDDVTVEGIQGLTPEALREAEAGGEVIKLVASATHVEGGGYRLVVEPRRLPQSHPLAGLSGHQMGLQLETDINGEIFLSIKEEDPTPTAAAMLRDLVLIARGKGRW